MALVVQVLASQYKLVFQRSLEEVKVAGSNAQAEVACILSEVVVDKIVVEVDNIGEEVDNIGEEVDNIGEEAGMLYNLLTFSNNKIKK